MGIRFDSVTVLCDATCKACTHRCSATTAASLDDGQLRVLIPAGWTQDGDMLLGPNCTEERALQRAMAAEVPDPDKDPPALKKDREERLKAMKEVVRADLEDREAEFPELREYVRQLVLDEGDVPDFFGHIGDAKVKTEVRVRGNYVEISFSHAIVPLLKGKNPTQHMSLTLKHENLELVDPPAFVDRQVVEWVQNCLRTMDLAEVSPDEPVAQ
jgi:hypothetical protein